MEKGEASSNDGSTVADTIEQFFAACAKRPSYLSRYILPATLSGALTCLEQKRNWVLKYKSSFSARFYT